MDEIELNYGAITIDNSTFKGEGYRFHEGLLAQMNQFKKSPVKVIQTDIVHNEAINHISQEITRTRAAIEQALRSANKQLKIEPDNIQNARVLLSVDGSESEIAESRLNEYYDYIGAEIIDSAKYADLSQLMQLYFSTEAPFETGKDKKNEFPDAIALSALEGWAEQNEVNIIAVSQDKGWKNYADGSSSITIVSSLAEALEKFQPHNKVASIIDRIRQDSLLDSPNYILGEIETAIDSSVDASDIWVEADSYLHYEWDDVFATYHSHQLDKDQDGQVKVRVVKIDDEEIVLKVGAIVQVDVEASFDFSVRDSVDNDYVGMGGNVCSTTESYHTDILLSFTGDFSQDLDDIQVSEVEVLETIKVAHFGDIEPDWKDEQGYEDFY